MTDIELPVRSSGSGVRVALMTTCWSSEPASAEGCAEVGCAMRQESRSPTEDNADRLNMPRLPMHARMEFMLMKPSDGELEQAQRGASPAPTARLERARQAGL